MLCQPTTSGITSAARRSRVPDPTPKNEETKAPLPTPKVIATMFARRMSREVWPAPGLDDTRLS
jgi:hypothetical protein